MFNKNEDTIVYKVFQWNAIVYNVVKITFKVQYCQ